MSKEAWLEKRRYNITATDIAAIMGQCKYGRKRYDVLCDKLGANVFIDNGYTRFGSVAEAHIAREAETRMGWCLVDDGCHTIAQHPDYPWATATLDRKFGVYITDEYEPVVPTFPVEIKSGSWRKPPKNYWWQCQWQMFVTNTNVNLLVQSDVPASERKDFDPRDFEDEEQMHCYVSDAVQRADLKVWPFYRDDAAISEALEAAMEFRHTALGFLR